MSSNKRSGGKFLSEESREKMKQEARDRILRRRWKRLCAALCLVLGDSLLLGMILGEKIDALFGVLFVAALSALCGAKIK